MEPNRGNMALGDIMTLHTRATVVGAALAAGLLWMAPANAQDSGTVTASLTITGECQVATAPVSASTGNFVTADVTIGTYGDFTVGDYAGWPQTPSNASGNVAVLCSAGQGATVTFATGDTMELSGSPTTVIDWTPQLGGSDINTETGTTANIPDTSETAGITYYEVTGVVAAEDISGAVPGTYTADVTVTVALTPAP